jgi:hypothetical protein
MKQIGAFLHWLATPLRALVRGLIVLINLSNAQIKALLTIGMLAGMFSLSVQNIAFTYSAKRAVAAGELYRPFFDLIQEQMRFNSALIAWFAIILGLIVFGADYFRAKVGDKELGFGRGDDGEGK